ncbi:MAG: cytochrome c oxidase accessory protein CcoG [Alphaproteobacteria bacterium]|nr:cytochrome c oxidase accessory protein CcoG [Alphaproteobacteria bacterium]
MLDEKHKPTEQGFETFDVEAVNKAGRRQPLYAARKKVFPKRAEGNFRRFKWIVMAITLTIYYVTPWLKWDRGPYAPDQFVLINLEARRFYFAFIEIWPQEFYYVAGMLVMAGIGLFLITSTVGRAWCGYACPQTVWVDLFLVVERAVEGDRNQRIKLDKAPWSADKLVRRVLKHGTWLLIAVSTGGAWIFYFADAHELLDQLIHFEAPMVAYGTIAVLTFTTYTFGGLMREQVCTYMCPWPRIQAAMLDEYSLTVTYNEWRGDPRSKHAKKMAAEGKPVGDCVDCNACVAVCPMGIDIRDGQQLECITCALCIDACDNVMDKIGKERGLISYATLNDYNENMALATGSDLAASHIVPANVRDRATGKLSDRVRHTNWRSIFRLRTLVYFLVWGGIGLGMLTVLALRSSLDINVLHDRNPLYVQLGSGDVRNGYDVKILNMANEPRRIELSLSGLPTGTMSLASDTGERPDGVTLDVEPDKVMPVRVYVTADPAALDGSNVEFNFVARNIGGPEQVASKVKFHSPER